MGLETASLAFSLGSSLVAAERSRNAMHKQKNLMDTAKTQANIETQSNALKLKESKQRTALGMARARNAGTDRMFKEGVAPSVNPPSSATLG